MIYFSYLISNFYSRLLMFNFEHLVSLCNEKFLFLLNQTSLGLLDGILSLLDEDYVPEGPYPDVNDPDPDGNDPDGNDPDPDGSGSDPDGDNPDEDSDRVQRLDKGKARAITPESISEEPERAEEPESPEENEDSHDKFQRDLEQAKLNSLKEKHEGVEPESSRQGAYREELEKQNKQNREREYKEANSLYKEAVENFNKNQSQIVDNDAIDPTLRQHFLEESQKLRRVVDYYKYIKETFKDELNISSEEEEYSSEEESSDEDNRSEDNRSEDSSSENSRPYKRPRN